MSYVIAEITRARIIMLRDIEGEPIIFNSVCAAQYYIATELKYDHSDWEIFKYE